MPSSSLEQHKLMEIAAHTPGGYGGVPQAVGKEFVAKDATEANPSDANAKTFEAPSSEATDHEVAEGIRDGLFASPQKFGEFWLFDLRITGTGMAFRDSLQEWAFRDPEVWLTDEFVQRCAGLPVIFEHPEKAGLNSDEYQDRAIGSIVLPYIKGQEVWGIAKIFNADAALAMQHTHTSTSPGVTPPKGAEPVTLEGGMKVLDEGLPLILDHLAVCELGVWDKDGPPEGIRIDSSGKGKTVADKSERELELEKERDDAKTRADAAEAELDRAKKDFAEKEDARKLKGAYGKGKRHDEEEHEGDINDCAKCDPAEKEDARKLKGAYGKGKRHDEEKHEGEVADCAKCDAAEKEDAHQSRGSRFPRRDGAPVEEVNANREEEIKDSKQRIALLEAKIADITRAQAPLTNDEANAISKAYARADSVYSMLNERAPMHLIGERPLAYCKRLANGLRKFTKTHKDEPIHDSISGRAFELIENEIYAEALAEAKNPTRNDSVGMLIETKSTGLGGKQVSKFTGDPNACWAPFMTPRTNITRFNNRAGGR